MIIVKKISDTLFEVTVKERTTTKHSVTLSHSDYQKLTGGISQPELLIQKSFEFLLEMEPNTSILSSFNLQIISRYFPEYERTIHNMLHKTQSPKPDTKGIA